MDIVELRHRLDKEFNSLDERFGYIVYCFDAGSGGQGTGFHRNADSGDAIVAIQRIIEQFALEPGALMTTLTE